MEEHLCLFPNAPRSHTSPCIVCRGGAGIAAIHASRSAAEWATMSMTRFADVFIENSRRCDGSCISCGSAGTEGCVPWRSLDSWEDWEGEEGSEEAMGSVLRVAQGRDAREERRCSEERGAAAEADVEQLSNRNRSLLCGGEGR